MKLKIIQTYQTEVDEFLKVWFFNKEFLELRAARLRLKLSKIDLEKRPHYTKRSLEFVPERNLPKSLTTILKGATQVKDLSILNHLENTCEVKIELPLISQLVSFNCSYRFIQLANSKMERCFTAEIRVYLPLIGKKIEKYFIDELEKGLIIDQSTFEEWQRTH